MTSTFPFINHLVDLVPFIEGNPQFRVQEQSNGTTVVCYMLQDEDTFTGDNGPISRKQVANLRYSSFAN